MPNPASSPPLLIFNPHAGSQRKSKKLSGIIHRLRRIFPNLETVSTGTRNDATGLTKEAAKKNYRLIACAGGDGTINEIVNGLAGKNTQLAILPTGTGNALAREVGLPMNPFKACDMIPELKPAAISLGRVDGRYFVLLAGIGFDAFIIQLVSHRLKRRF